MNAPGIGQLDIVDGSLDSRAPGGDIQTRWDRHRFEMKLVNPANKRKYTVIVVGTGLAGGSAAASLAELGYNVLNFCIHDSPRRAHSVAAQGGINAAKNYPNDGDSVWRLFYDTIKGGDFRAREARADHDHAELSLVGRVHQLHLEAVLVPLLGERAGGDLGVELEGH
jgi:succinate dehydrogenase / fumarate reductase flavoprotein subunit